MKIGAMNNPEREVTAEVRWIGENKFDYVDLTYEPPSAKNIDTDEIKRLLKKYDLFIIGHTNPGLPAIYPLPEIQNFCLEELKRAVDLFVKLGVKKVNIHPYYDSEPNQIIDKNIKLISKLIAYTKENKVELMLENFLYPFDSAETFKIILQEIPDLKIHLDIGHCNIGQDAERLVRDFFDMFGDRIIHLHLHDNKGELDEHLPLGCGDLHWAKIMRQIIHLGYDDTITLEIFSEDRDYLKISRDKLQTLLSDML